MRVAFVGKGGAGKSAIAGTFARVLARRVGHVLVLDSDPMPGLAFSLGMEPLDVGIVDEVVEDRPESEGGRRYRLRAGLDAVSGVERYALRGPDGVRVLQIGKLRGHVRALVRSQAAFAQIVEELPIEAWNLVGDLPGGVRQPFAGWADYAELLLVVVEPSTKSVLTARRLARIGHGGGGPAVVRAVVSKARTADDAMRVAASTGLEVVAVVPWDGDVAEAERYGVAPIDYAPGCVAVQAIASLVDRLIEELPVVTPIEEEAAP